MRQICKVALAFSVSVFASLIVVAFAQEPKTKLSEEDCLYKGITNAGEFRKDGGTRSTCTETVLTVA